MLIKNILTASQDAKAWSKSAQGYDAAVRRGLNALTGRSTPLPGSGSSAVGQILAQYDVSDITPKKFSEMVQKLRDTGSLNDSEIRDLTQIRNDLDASGIQPDEEVDLVAFFQQRIHSLQIQAQSLDSGSTQFATVKQSTAAAQQRLDWMQKLATMHEASDSVGLDAFV